MVKKSPTPLETIFESGHKKKGALGKQKVRRKIESIDYWLEDKAKTRHRSVRDDGEVGHVRLILLFARRSKMTTKALQGRPRLMFCGLTEEQEKKLERLLSEQQEDSDAHEETAAGRDDSDVLSGLASTNHHVGESGAMLPEDELRRAIAEADAVFGTIGSTAASTKSRKKKGTHAVTVAAPSMTSFDLLTGTGAPTERRDSVSLKVRRSLRILRRTVQVGGDDDVKDGSVYETTEMMVPEGRKGNLIKKLAVDAPRPRT